MGNMLAQLELAELVTPNVLNVLDHLSLNVKLVPAQINYSIPLVLISALVVTFPTSVPVINAKIIVLNAKTHRFV